MRNRFLFLLFAVAQCIALDTLAADVPTPFALPNTEVREIHAEKLNRDYELFVSLPQSYGKD